MGSGLSDVRTWVQVRDDCERSRVAYHRGGVGFSGQYVHSLRECLGMLLSPLGVFSVLIFYRVS